MNLESEKAITGTTLKDASTAYQTSPNVTSEMLAVFVPSVAVIVNDPPAGAGVRNAFQPMSVTVASTL